MICMTTEGTYVRRASGLVRSISAWDALMFCTVTPGPVLGFLYTLWAPALYPGASMPFAVLMMLTFIPSSLVLYLLSISMPRSGGEYVYASRILHPVLGFFASWLLCVIMYGWYGELMSWCVTFGLSPLVYSAGVLTGNSGLTSFGTQLGNTAFVPGFLISVVLLLFAAFLIWRGTRVTMRALWFCIAVAFLGMFSVMIAAATSSQMDFISRLQSLGGINYQTQILNPALKLGLTPGLFSVSASVMAGMTFINLNLIGNTWSANVAGEVKNPSKSIPLAIFGGMVILLVLWGLEYSLIWINPGGDFWHANSILYWAGQSPFPVPPVVNMIALYLTSNPILIYVASIGYFCCSFATALSCGFTPSRITFAWALDRVIPDAFGKVDKRGTPRATWLLGLVIGFIILVFYAFTNWLAYILYSISEWFIAWIVVGVAAIVFPYVKKDIFEKSPSIVKAKFGGLPLITIAGVLMTIVSAYSVYASIVPGLTGTTSLYHLVGSIVFIAVLPVIVYCVAYFYRRSKGVSLELQYRTIPPD